MKREHFAVVRLNSLHLEIGAKPPLILEERVAVMREPYAQRRSINELKIDVLRQPHEYMAVVVCSCRRVKGELQGAVRPDCLAAGLRYLVSRPFVVVRTGIPKALLGNIPF